MKQNLIELIKEIDLEKINFFIDSDKIHSMRFCQRKNDSDVFLQLAFDEEISFDEYYVAENQILNMCQFLYEDNIDDDILSYFITEQDALSKGFYAIETLELDERNKALSINNKLISSKNWSELELFVKLACREIAISVFYFKEKNVLLVIDSIGGVIWCPKIEYMIETLYKMESDFTINYYKDI